MSFCPFLELKTIRTINFILELLTVID